MELKEEIIEELGLKDGNDEAWMNDFKLAKNHEENLELLKSTGYAVLTSEFD